MQGFSHADRIGGNERLLDARRIQEVICRGEDIFGMLPEAYSVSLCESRIFVRTNKTFIIAQYADLLSQMYLQP